MYFSKAACRKGALVTAVTSEQAGSGFDSQPLCVDMFSSHLSGFSPLVFFLRSMNITWTGDWCTGGLSRLLPSDHWDRLQHHLSPSSRISRITEDKWPDTCMLKVKGRFLGSWLVMEAEWCICFLSMADKIKATSLVSPSISLFLPNKSRGKKNNTQLNVRWSNQATEALYLRVKWSAGQPITALCHRPKHMTGHVESAGEKSDKDREHRQCETPKGHGHSRAGCYGWACVSCSPTTLKQGGQWTPC